jgi:hypothetical protein
MRSTQSWCSPCSHVTDTEFSRWLDKRKPLQDVHPDDDDGPTYDEIIEDGERAVERVIKGQHFEDWLVISKALHMGRVRCMREAETNHHTGKRYIKVYGRWLDEHPQFKKLDGTTVNQCHELYKNREAIINWRATLADNERMQWNYPETVLRHWKARTQTPKEKKPSKRNEQIRAIEEENSRLRKENEKLKRDSGNVFTPKDAPDDIARVLWEMLPGLTIKQVRKISAAWCELIKARSHST